MKVQSKVESIFIKEGNIKCKSVNYHHLVTNIEEIIILSINDTVVIKYVVTFADFENLF